MSHIIRIADEEGRVSLPGFANAVVILEAVGPDEYRVRRIEAGPNEEVRFLEEEMPLQLSERDALLLLELFENPPPPNEAARRAVKRFKEHYG